MLVRVTALLASLALSLPARAEVCADGRDDDGDGWTDCDDPDCGADATCCASGPGDADGDGLCDGADVCPAPGVGLDPFEPIDLLAPLMDPSDLEVVDLDGDGDLDLLGAERNQDEIVWAPNLGGTRFGRSRVIATLDYPLGVDAADLDGDGDLDVLVATFNEDRVTWSPNLGGGTFGAARTLATVNGASAVLAADLDGDGDLDVAMASDDDDRVLVSENRGQGVFRAAVALGGTIGHPSRIVAADLDGDRALDLAVEVRDDALPWYRNLGGLSFSSAQVVGSVGATSLMGGLAAADLDGDGRLDLTTAASPGGQGWFRNQGGGAFGAFAPLSDQANGADDVASADLDLDGDADVVTNPDTRFYENLGGGVFGAPESLGDSFGTPELVDLDGDGWKDVVASNGLHDSVGWLRNTLECHTLDLDLDGLADVEELSVYGTDPLVTDTDADGLDDGLEVSLGLDPAAADTDADGVDDALDACPLDPDPTQPDADGDGRGDACDVCLGTDALGDADADGVCDDLDACAGDDGTGDVDADGLCADSDSCPTDANADQADADADGSGDPCDLCHGDDRTGDPDGDGRCADADVCAFVSDPGQPDADADGAGDACDVCARPGDGVDLYGPLLPTGAPALADEGDAADLDGDGVPDLVSSVDWYSPPFYGSSGCELWWQQGLGDGQYGPPELLHSGTPWHALPDVDPVDLDADGDLDLLFAEANVMWVENLGGGLFAAAVRLERSPGPDDELPSAVDEADLDGDGDLDVVLSSGWRDARWFENRGGGLFRSARVIASRASWLATAVATVDLDADGDLDVAVGWEDGQISWVPRLAAGFGAARVLSPAPQAPPASHYEVEELVTADVDGDGLRDLVGAWDAVFTSYGVGLHLSRPGGPTARIDAPGVGAAGDVAAGDADGDGDVDLVVESLDDPPWGERGLWLYENVGTAFEPRWLNEAVGRVAGVDLEPDGDLDLLVGTRFAESLAECAFLDGDADGATDAVELIVMGSDPAQVDTDAGGMDDGVELLLGNDAADPLDDELQAGTPTPGVAGVVNELSVWNGTPGGTVVALTGVGLGSAPVPFPACSGTRTGLRGPVVAVASAPVNAIGRATVSGRILQASAGRTTAYQILDLESCRLTTVRVETW